jgi:aminobenzoyl-glutamate utilization protein B
MVAAKVIAATGIDLLTRPDLVQKARAFFQQATGGKPYQSPIPKDQPPPVGAKND